MFTKPITSSIKFTVILYGVLCLSLIYGCGKRRPPTPPSKSSVNITLATSQQGDKIILVISPPNLTKQISVYRLSESTTNILLTEDEFASQSTTVSTIDTTKQLNPETVLYTDTLTNTNPLSRLRYAVKYVFEDGRQSGFSNFSLIEPFFNVATPPSNLEASANQSAIKLNWEKPLTNIDRTQPANVVGYNIYRKTSAQKSPVLLNTALIRETVTSDGSFKFGEDYEYFVRAVTVASNGVPIESLDSNIVKVNFRDVFPPAAPLGLTIAAAPNSLSLFFAANSESDIVGYQIYRSADEKLPLSQWQKLNQILIRATTFQDIKVESGHKYYYYVIAVDNAGNLSAPSEVVSEVVP